MRVSAGWHYNNEPGKVQSNCYGYPDPYHGLRSGVTYGRGDVAASHGPHVVAHAKGSTVNRVEMRKARNLPKTPARR